MSKNGTRAFVQKLLQSFRTEQYCLTRTQSSCEDGDAASQFCRVAACEAEHEGWRLFVFCCEHRQWSYFKAELLRLLRSVVIGLECFEPTEGAYACACVDYVEHSLEVFV